MGNSLPVARDIQGNSDVGYESSHDDHDTTSLGSIAADDTPSFETVIDDSSLVGATLDSNDQVPTKNCATTSTGTDTATPISPRESTTATSKSTTAATILTSEETQTSDISNSKESAFSFSSSHEKPSVITKLYYRPAKRKKKYSDYIGVTLSHGKYQAVITHSNKQHYLGRYILSCDAAAAYDQAAVLLNYV